MEIAYSFYEEFPTNFSTDGNLSLHNFRVWQHEVYRTNRQKRCTTNARLHPSVVPVVDPPKKRKRYNWRPEKTRYPSIGGRRTRTRAEIQHAQTDKETCREGS